MGFKFKSSGVNISHRKFKPTEDQIKSQIVPIGIKTPLDFGDDKNEYLNCNTDPIEQIKDNLRNLILTNRGERLGRFDYGCDLRSFLNEANSLGNQLEPLMTKSIIDQCTAQLPMVNIQDVTYDKLTKGESGSASGLSVMNINVKFAVPKLKQNNLGIQINMFMGG